MPIVRDDGYETTEEASEKLKFNFSISSFFFWKLYLFDIWYVFAINYIYANNNVQNPNREFV